MQDLLGREIEEEQPKYSPQFLSAWDAYPHHRNRRHKHLAYAVWKRRHLDGKLAGVMHLLSMRCADDWGGNSREFVPAMEVWLRRIDPQDVVEIFHKPYVDVESPTISLRRRLLEEALESGLDYHQARTVSAEKFAQLQSRAKHNEGNGEFGPATRRAYDVGTTRRP